MRTIGLLLLSASLVAAWQDAEKKVDPALHADVLTLVDLEGVRAKMEASIPGSVERGRQIMLEKCAGCTPEFGDEWVKRMKARMSPDELTQVVVRTYEKDLTDAEVKQLIPVVRATKDGKAPVIPDDLKQKISTVFPGIQSEIVAGCTQIGAKLGSDIGTEIQKEHPDWVKPAPR